MLDIQWSAPYKVYYGSITKWRREWIIPKQRLSAFFQFWKKYKIELLVEGFSVIKSKITDKWYLYETKDDVLLFKQFSTTDSTTDSTKEEIPVPQFQLPSYNLKMTDGLRPWQVTAAEKIISALNYWGSAVDGSEMGVGKTFTSCGIVHELNIPFIIICPKPVICQWNKVITNHFKLKNLCKGIINYELLIRGRKDSTIASFVLSRETRRKRFVWKIPKKTILIWDEAHRLKNWKTKNSKVCIEAYKQGYQQLFLSATLAASPLDLRTIGTCTKLFSTANEYYTWVKEHGVYQGNWGLEFNNDQKMLKKIHTYLFEHRGTRLQRDVIPNFPESEIIVSAYDMDEEDASKIRAIYDEMKRELKVLDNKIKQDGDSEMVIRMRALQKAELLKLSLIEEMIQDGIENGMSVVVFLNYSDSIDALAKKFNTKCIYDGRNVNCRQEYVNDFQSNKERLLITNSAAAKEGLNLGDEFGGHPRLSLISPNDSITKIKQCLGRVHRENSKSKSIQKIVYIAGTQEMDVVENVGKKLENLTLINNGEITDNDLKIK